MRCVYGLSFALASYANQSFGKRRNFSPFLKITFAESCRVCTSLGLVLQFKHAADEHHVSAGGVGEGTAGLISI